jgi:hypothetical protein
MLGLMAMPRIPRPTTPNPQLTTHNSQPATRNQISEDRVQKIDDRGQMSRLNFLINSAVVTSSSSPIKF